MISSNITNIGTWGRVRLRRATFELLEFSPVPPSSYLRMFPECTPRTSPSMFLRWTTPRGSTEMKMTSRPRPGCSSVTRWSLGPPAMTVLAQRTKESQPTSRRGETAASRKKRRGRRNWEECHLLDHGAGRRDRRHQVRQLRLLQEVPSLGGPDDDPFRPSEDHRRPRQCRLFPRNERGKRTRRRSKTKLTWRN